jgi:hypothetical protein
VFAGLWLLSTVALGWVMLQSRQRVPSTFAALLAVIVRGGCTIALPRLLQQPPVSTKPTAPTRPWPLAGAIGAAVPLLFVPSLVRPLTYVLLVPVALGLLIWQRPRFSRRGAVYTLFPGAVATLAGR